MRTLNLTDLRVRFATGCLRTFPSLAFTVTVCTAAVCCGGDLRQYWPFDDGAGTTATNAVTGGNDGTLEYIGDGWTSDVPEALVGRSAGSLNFPNTNTSQRVNAGPIGLAADGGARGASLSFWLKPASAVKNTRLWSMIRTTYSAPAPQGIVLVNSSGGEMTLCGHDASGGQYRLLANGYYKTNRWQHLCFVWENNHLVTYHNGNPAGSIINQFFEADIDPNNGTPMSLGLGARYGTRAVPYDGKMDDFAVWDGALTPERVRQLASGVSPLAIAPQGDVVAPDPPLVSYLMDGNAQDAGGNHHGNVTGDAEFTDAAGDTPFAYTGNKALQLDGNDDGVMIADDPALRPGTNAWTLSLWFKTSTPNQLATLIEKKKTDSPNTRMQVVMGGTATGSIGTGNSVHTLLIGAITDGWWEVHTRRGYADGKWHHVALVRGDGDWHPVLYVDGMTAPLNVNLDLGIWPHDIDCTEPWYIGGRDGSYFTGLIDEVAMWDKALTSEQVAWLAHNSLASIAPPQAPALPLAAYRMNNNARDACGEHHGVLAGNATFVSGDTPFPSTYVHTPNHALQLDGNGAYMTIGDTPALRPSTNAWTLSLWFKTAVGDSISGLIAKRNDSEPNTQMSLLMGGNTAGTVGTGGNLHTFLIGAETLGDRWEVSTRADYADGAWHHAALVRPAGDRSPVLFVDGVMTAVLVNKDTGQRPHDIDCTAPWIIGATSGTDADTFNGLIDEVAMWDTALRAEEIEWLANNSIDTLFPTGGALILLR